MSKKHFVKPLVDALKPKGRRGALPTVTPCPYCGVSLSKTAHATHRNACQQDHRDAPPQMLEPADFLHDAGGRYNADGTFPQR